MPANVPALNSSSSGQPRPAELNRAAVLTAIISGLFCLVLVLGMIVQHVRSKVDDPLKAPQMAALKDQLATSPKDEQLKQHIREQDLELRQSYFRQLSMNGAGGWMLLGGLAVFLLAAKQIYKLHVQPPRPQLAPDAAERAARYAAQARWSVAALGALLVLAFAGLGLTMSTAVPSRPSELEQLLAQDNPASAASKTPGPSPAEYQANWPRFRGPGGNGLIGQTNFLLQFEVASGAGIAWKSPVPASGFNSPIVWGNHVFISGGDKKKRKVMCYELASGNLLWERPVENVPGNTGKLPNIPEQTGFAAATMATDGQRAYVIFANGDLAAFNFDGTLAWAKNLGVPQNTQGHASSLTTWQDRLIVQLDQGSPDEHLSRLYALDGATGNIVWQRQPPVGESWTTPIVIEAAGKTQIITLGPPWVIANSTTDGTELWRAEGLEGEVTPSPIFVNDMLYVVSPNMYLMAIRPDGQGDVTKTHILWKAEDGIPDITSPVSNGELVFLVSSYGMVTCYDAKEGKKVWEHDYEMDFNASPTLVGQRLLIFAVDGSAIVLEAGREFKELARSSLGEKVYASPAFVQNYMIVRSAKNLFCIGAKDNKMAEAK